MADPASAAVSDQDGAGRDTRYRERTCQRAMDESPTGGLVKTTEPAAGSVVSAGQIVKVALRWEPADRPDGDLHKVIDCVVVDGVLDAGLSAEERPTANDGVFETEFVVPDLAAGAEVCNFGFLSDDAGGHDYVRSETLCLSLGDQLPAAVTPPPAEVAGGTEVVQPAPVPAAAPASAPEVMGEVLSVPELPRTGLAEDLRILAGSALALGGLAIVVSTKRRR